MSGGGISLLGSDSVGGFLGDPAGMITIANTLVNKASDAALALSGSISGYIGPVITPDFGSPGSAPAIVIGALPEFTSAIWTSPALPSAFSGELDVTGLLPEPFDDAAPVLSFAPVPTAFSESAPDAPGVVFAFDDPTLTVSLPERPDLLTISVSNFSGMSLPTFSATEPTLDLIAPSVVAYTPGASYTSALLMSMTDKLTAWISGGGTGLSPEVENAIWERGREREARAQQDAILKLEQMEGLGYALPPGIYLDARLKVITETDYAERGHSREVMIKAAELEQENIKTALNVAVQIEGRLIDANNAVEQRLFESTKYATEAGIALYNARVEAFGRYVQIYQTKVQIYEALVRAEVAKVEAYKAQVSAEQAKAQTNTAIVEQYKAQADVALSAVRIYEAQIAAIQTKASIEKMKIEVFGEEVRAYATKVNAYTAGVEGFKASIEAEGAKQRAYQSAVDAYSARVSAAAKVADARIAAFRGLIDAKTLDIEQYKAAVSGETARIQGIVSGNQVLADTYKAQVTGDTSYNEVLTKQWQAALEQAQRTAEIGVSAAKANAELYVNGRSLASDAAKISAQVMAQLGAAALNTVNWSNSIAKSYSASDSFGMSSSFSQVESSSSSTSDSTSNNTNYNYSV